MIRRVIAVAGFALVAMSVVAVTQAMDSWAPPKTPPASPAPGVISVESVQSQYPDPCPGGCQEWRRLAPAEPFTSGDDVRELQVGLLLLGYFPGETDGVFGPRTMEAVRRFQVDYGLAGDGVVSRDTWRAMADQYAEMAGRSPRQDKNPPPPHLEDTESPPGPENISLLVDTDARTLSVMHGTTIIRQYRVAVGKESSPTPHGDWFIKEKDTWAGAFGTRWMRLSIPWGTYGLHGTNKPWSIGTYASHGCIRMLNREVEEVFQVVSVGTPIRVVGKPEAQYGEVKRYIVQTHRGSDVLAMQCRLIEVGYDPGIPDGIFGPDTTRALLQFQRDQGLKADGVVDEATGRALDLW